MKQWNPEQYGDMCARWLVREEPCSLGPGRPDRAVQGELRKLQPADLFGPAQVGDRQMADCCLAALWLRHDFLDESHQISQAIETTTGSYWHGIMHRREPDFSNAKYWFRKVGSHPTAKALGEAARRLAEQYPQDPAATIILGWKKWNAAQFVDLCERTIQQAGPDADSLCRQIADSEWRILFDYCYHQAVA